jgi:hypothetical protein
MRASMGYVQRQLLPGSELEYMGQPLSPGNTGRFTASALRSMSDLDPVLGDSRWTPACPWD